MTVPATPERHTPHCFPADMIGHGIWLYDSFCLSYPDVDERLFVRGILVTDEAMRQWGLKFGHAYAHQLRHRRPRPGDTWHMDEVFRTINGARHDLGRAVDQDGHVLDILGQSHRAKQAAKPFCRLQLKGLTDIPWVLIAEGLSCSPEVLMHERDNLLERLLGRRGGEIAGQKPFALPLK